MKKTKSPDLAAALDETLRLYHAWLAYLLTRLGEKIVRVEADELRRALADLSCAVSREDDAYIIRLGILPDAEKKECTDAVPADPAESVD